VYIHSAVVRSRKEERIGGRSFFAIAFFASSSSLKYLHLDREISNPLLNKYRDIKF